MIQKRLRKLVFYKIVLVVFWGCISQKNTEERKISFKMFDAVFFSVMSNPMILESDDGYNGSVIYSTKDTIWFNFGYDINNLSEKDPVVIFSPYDEDSIRMNLDTTLVDPSRIIYTKKPNFDIDEFRIQNVFFEIVSDRQAKITIPRQAEKVGVSGIYVDSLFSTEGGRLKFNFYARNLDSLRQDLLLQTIRSIRFKIPRSL